ncbi:MAG: hypothetical protein U1E72_06630 [Burkholderiaceae bacterium]
MVIGSGDLVLTIGYLVLETEQVQLITDDEREVPAQALVGYDVATGNWCSRWRCCASSPRPTAAPPRWPAASR